MTALTERPPTRRGSPFLLRTGLALLAATQSVIGVWALFAPHAFYAAFPGAGHAWVALLPPFNEHLVRDVGALSLATAVLLTVAAVTADRLVSGTALAAYAAYALPHTLFHGLHLEEFTLVDAAAQMGGFLLQLVLLTGLAWLLWRNRARPPAVAADLPSAGGPSARRPTDATG